MIKFKQSKSIKPFLASSIMALSLFSAGTLAPLSTSMAVTCVGNNCNNTSPVTTGCSSGAVIKKTKEVYNTQFPNDWIATVRLVYSPTCDTFWSVVILRANHGATDIYTTATRTNSTIQPDYSVYDTDLDLWYPVTVYSPQIYIPPSSTDQYAAKACGYLTNQTDMEGEGCTTLWTGI